MAGKWDGIIMESSYHWIGLRENFNRKLAGFYHQIGWAFL
jgi:hypothetical protein